MQQINYHTNEPITTLTHKEARTIRHSAYSRGLKAGLLIAILTLTLPATLYIISTERQLTAEAHATTYYYNLATQCDTTNK